ncbi:MAG: hypothetical protein HeimC2_00990 [Candidatus Heimdallarchaeota archaeon LC_2]|nr:MAG: hypothetical protein HeimC2_00990 [Candidatus Heimdallarchaeota archaeon LC_2]
MKLILCLGIIILNYGILSIIAIHSEITEPNNTSTSHVNPILLQYVDHEPIQISSQTDVTILGIPGSGTDNDPYIIEGLYISGNKTTFRLIEIRSWTSLKPHFIIRNNFLYGNGSNAIYFEQIKNGQIYNNVIEFADTGITIVQDGSDSPNNELSIFNNTISNSYSTGIHASQVHYTKILNNTIVNSGVGITLTGNSINTIIGNNTIDNMTYIGISGLQWHGYGGGTAMGFNLTISNNLINNASDGIIWQHDQSLITQNNITNSRNIGIKLSQFVTIWSEGTNVLLNSGGNNIISSNLIRGSDSIGISIAASTSNIFRENEIVNSGSSGILISGITHSNLEKPSNNNTFEHNKISFSDEYGVQVSSRSNNNSFISNYFNQNNFGNDQAYDETGTTKFELNYWDDWMEIDKNEDGIIDKPYEFQNNSDLYPRVNPDIYLNLIKPEIPVHIPVITVENDGIIIVKKTVTITETTIPIKTEIISRSYDVPPITLFIVFSFIGILTIQGKNPVLNRILKKTSEIRYKDYTSSSGGASHLENLNLNIHCTACGTTNPPLSLYCMECGISQDD